MLLGEESARRDRQRAGGRRQAAQVSGDIYGFRHGRIGNQVIKYPASLGHECAGTVVEVGERRENAQTGRPRGRRSGNQLRPVRSMPCGPRKHLPKPAIHGRSRTKRPARRRNFPCCPRKIAFRFPSRCRSKRPCWSSRFRSGFMRCDWAKFGRTPRLPFSARDRSASACCFAPKRSCRRAKFMMTDLIGERLPTAHCGADWTGNARGEDVHAAVSATRNHEMDSRCSKARDRVHTQEELGQKHVYA